MHCLVGLITGHVALNRHLKLVGIKDSPLCPLGSEEEETVLYFLDQCPALVTIRQRVLAMHSFTALKLGKVRFSKLIRLHTPPGGLLHLNGALGMHTGPNQGLVLDKVCPKEKKEEKKTSKYSLWVIQKCASQIHDGGRLPS